MGGRGEETYAFEVRFSLRCLGATVVMAIAIGRGYEYMEVTSCCEEA